MKTVSLFFVFFLVSTVGCSTRPEPTATPSFTPVPTWTSTPVVQIQSAAQATAEPSQRESYDTSSSSALEWPFGLQPTEKVVAWTQEFYDAELRAGVLDEEGGKGLAVLFYPAMLDLLQSPCRGDLDDLGRTFKYYFENPYAIRSYREMESALEFPAGYLPYIMLMIYVSFTIEQESSLNMNEDIGSVPADSFDCDQIIRDMDLEGLKAIAGHMNDKLEALDAKYK